MAGRDAHSAEIVSAAVMDLLGIDMVEPSQRRVGSCIAVVAIRVRLRQPVQLGPLQHIVVRDCGSTVANNCGDRRPPMFLRSPDGRITLNVVRSEEHTTELQSLRHRVCRLLLAKKGPTADPPPGRLRIGRPTAGTQSLTES